MIVLCSVSDRAAWRGTVYATTMKPIGSLPLIQCLRPTQEMVYGVKYRGWSHKRYETVYRALLRSRWPDVRAWLDTLRPDVDVTLLCYCRPGVYCHRHLIARMLARHRPDIPLDVR